MRKYPILKEMYPKLKWYPPDWTCHHWHRRKVSSFSSLSVFYFIINFIMKIWGMNYTKDKAQCNQWSLKLMLLGHSPEKKFYQFSDKFSFAVTPSSGNWVLGQSYLNHLGFSCKKLLSILWSLANAWSLDVQCRIMSSPSGRKFSEMSHPVLQK